MKSTHGKLMLVISLSLLLLVTFYNEIYADISRYNWEFPHPPVKMIPVKEGICALTGMAGKFRGGGEAVFVSPSGDSWYLGGFSKQGYMWAQAHCVKYKDFGKDFVNIQNFSISGWWGCQSSYCKKQEVVGRNLTYGCRQVFLQGISGDFERPSLWGSPLINASYVKWTASDGRVYDGLGISTHGKGYRGESREDYRFATMKGMYGCLMGQVLPEYKNRKVVSAEFKLPFNQDIKTNYFANSYFCTIVGVGGYFHGGGERVNLAINSKGEWIMQGQSMQTYSSMAAWCFRYK